ncbi:MAG: bifunctional glutamate N-acetyltransferase/amino-acid acetyltransferase ArgJ [Bacteroidota bacterium]|nr:bifunctional glutamate N-acetyltransferase/amino-acid acetyltransferase ArgJ [Bacteroidota bacterium]
MQFLKEGSITSVKGIKAAGIFSGIKKAKKDLALIYSEAPCTAAGTFTLNKVKAAPTVISQNSIKTGQTIRAILINSGNANACTGDPGFSDAYDTRNYCAAKLGISSEETLLSSTGVIGVKLPVEKIKKGIDKIVPLLSASGGLKAAEAILTTDLKIKSYAVTVKLSTGKVTIGGICKGSGMIMPNMATMLGFIATDAKIEKPVLQQLLSAAVNISFNRITVDGDTSTNDMVILLANGLSEINITENTKDYSLFLEALTSICKEMAKAIVVDGEGATKLIQLDVKHAKSLSEANLVAKGIANSPLVKTAFYGEDANWGRILSAAGNSGAEFNPAKVSIYFDELPVFMPDYEIVLDEVKAKEILIKDSYTVTIDLQAGDSSTTWWTCDLSQNYIKINAMYRS